MSLVHTGFSGTFLVKYTPPFINEYPSLTLLMLLLILSAPEPKVQVHYCDHALSVVRPSVCLSLTFHIFDFSSETAEQNSTKVDGKQDLNVLYQVFVFLADRKK